MAHTRSIEIVVVMYGPFGLAGCSLTTSSRVFLPVSMTPAYNVK